MCRACATRVWRHPDPAMGARGREVNFWIMFGQVYWRAQAPEVIDLSLSLAGSIAAAQGILTHLNATVWQF